MDGGLKKGQGLEKWIGVGGNKRAGGGGGLMNLIPNALCKSTQCSNFEASRQIQIDLFCSFCTLPPVYENLLGETSKFPFWDHRQTTKDDKRR